MKIPRSEPLITMPIGFGAVDDAAQRGFNVASRGAQAASSQLAGASQQLFAEANRLEAAEELEEKKQAAAQQAAYDEYQYNQGILGLAELTSSFQDSSIGMHPSELEDAFRDTQSAREDLFNRTAQGMNPGPIEKLRFQFEQAGIRQEAAFRARQRAETKEATLDQLGDIALVLQSQVGEGAPLSEAIAEATAAVNGSSVLDANEKRDTLKLYTGGLVAARAESLFDSLENADPKERAPIHAELKALLREKVAITSLSRESLKTLRDQADASSRATKAEIAGAGDAVEVRDLYIAANDAGGDREEHQKGIDSALSRGLITSHQAASLQIDHEKAIAESLKVNKVEANAALIATGVKSVDPNSPLDRKSLDVIWDNVGSEATASATRFNQEADALAAELGETEEVKEMRAQAETVAQALVVGTPQHFELVETVLGTTKGVLPPSLLSHYKGALHAGKVSPGAAVATARTLQQLQAGNPRIVEQLGQQSEFATLIATQAIGVQGDVGLAKAIAEAAQVYNVDAKTREVRDLRFDEEAAEYEGGLSSPKIVSEILGYGEEVRVPNQMIGEFIAATRASYALNPNIEDAVKAAGARVMSKWQISRFADGAPMANSPSATWGIDDARAFNQFADDMVKLGHPEIAEHLAGPVPTAGPRIGGKAGYPGYSLFDTPGELVTDIHVVMSPDESHLHPEHGRPGYLVMDGASPLNHADGTPVVWYPDEVFEQDEAERAESLKRSENQAEFWSDSIKAQMVPAPFAAVLKGVGVGE